MSKTNPEKKKYPVFISYCQSDGLGFGQNLKQVLDGLGYLTFLSDKSMDQYIGDTKTPAGERILKMVDNCTYFVLILTPNALKSEFIKKEICRAQGRSKIIFPYYKKPELSSSDITGPFAINQTHYGKFKTEEELATLVFQKIKGEEQANLESMGIKQIFENRHSDEYIKTIKNCILSQAGGEVRMLGISFRDWFGEPTEKSTPKYAETLSKAMTNEVKFKVLLIDPTSDIAKERAIVESGEEYKKDEKFVTSPLFQDIKKVALWISNYETKARDLKQQPSIEAHFYDFMLSLYAIITPTCTFVEQYHIGAISGKRAPGDESALCLGGYVPVFQIENNSHFGTAIFDHFNNIWNHSIREEESRGNTFQAVLKNIGLLEKDPLKFRLEQFAVKTHRRGNNILNLIRREDQTQSIESNY